MGAAPHRALRLQEKARREHADGVANHHSGTMADRAIAQNARAWSRR
jgi:hypothetical protein